MTDRRALRSSARAARAAHVAGLSVGQRAAFTHAAAERLGAALPALWPAAPGVAASYAAHGDELDPALLDAPLAAAGWTLAFPRVVGAAPLAFHACSRAALAPGFKGILEPPADAPLVTPALVIVPLLAFDATGNRLGQGAGHYDRTLAALRAAGRVVAVGLAWNPQALPSLPAMPHDEPLDAVATPRAFQRFR